MISFFKVRSLRELREPRDRVEGQRQEGHHQLELQGLRPQLQLGHAPQAHHLHRQGLLLSVA